MSRTDIDYKVGVENIFSGISPEDAILQMAGWLDDSSYAAFYRVTWIDADGVEQSRLIDVESIDSNAVHDELMEKGGR